MNCPGARIHASLGIHELGTQQGQCSICTDIRKPVGYDKIRDAVTRLLDEYAATHRRLGNTMSAYRRDEMLLKLEVIHETLVLWSLPGVADGQQTEA